MERKLDIPLNANERYLYAICMRLDALIEMMNSFIQVYANQNNLATTQNVVEEKVTKPRKSKG
ncbi:MULTISPECIES: hypothetical protein [unclassified Dehalobacter]|uniref:hypothetical protein n=1 Tax=unclassified Dehalobacter TaxID=2635733 RepID=UPI000E6B8660|nr:MULTISPECIES: hypothetical protein [unclassified Dehalobacter]RJE47675.1 hypothetical protein A7K50_03235 [Dehalobacter sp. MCB1]TCX53830.1 hypothetical protein C1I36_03610 [Dehalobacter sp. 14DCB1]